MKDIFGLIDCWKTTRSIPILLDAGYDLAAIGQGRAALEGVDVQTRREAFRILREITEALVTHMTQWRHDIDQLQRQIQQGQLRQKACLAYHKRDRFHKNRTGI